VAFLNQLLRYAQKRDWIVRNPFDKLDDHQKPKRGPGRERVLSTEELQALVDRAKPRWKLPIKLLAFTGLRAGELLGVRGGDMTSLRGR
jgi:integrase